LFLKTPLHLADLNLDHTNTLTFALSPYFAILVNSAYAL